MMVFMFTYLECNECTCNQHLIMTQQASSACFETLKTISLSLSFSLPLAHSIAYTHTHTHTSPQLPWERVGWNSPGQKRIADRKACQKRTSTDGLPTSFNLGVGGGWGWGGVGATLQVWIGSISNCFQLQWVYISNQHGENNFFVCTD